MAQLMMKKHNVNADIIRTTRTSAGPMYVSPPNPAATSLRKCIVALPKVA